MASLTNLQMNWLPLQKRKGGPLGLKNLGNSCYLNSVLQCLTYTPPLANFCLLKHHTSSCTSINGGSNSVCPFCLLEKWISRSLSIDSVSESPSRIYSCLALFAKHFRQGWQEDAHEFLRYVIEACNSVCVKLHKLLLVTKLRTRQDSQKECKEEPRTVVKDIFGGVLQSQVKCLSCNAESNKLDDIMDLSLDVFKIASVRDAMRRYFQPEVLDGSNKYKCEKCKKLTAARKQMSIFQAPNVLVIQLKRFENFYGGKIDRHISFEERLELNGHMCHKKQDQRPEYLLYACIVHDGFSQESGHYYSYVKDKNGKWYCCNDAHVTSVSVKSVLLEKAYILFYVRHSTKAINSSSAGSHNDMSTLAVQDALESKESSVKEKDVGEKSHISSVSSEKGQGVQQVKFNIMRPGSQDQARKHLTSDNGGAATRSLTDSRQGKTFLGADHIMSNGASNSSGSSCFSNNNRTETLKQDIDGQKQCFSQERTKEAPTANGNGHNKLASMSETLQQDIGGQKCLSQEKTKQAPTSNGVGPNKLAAMLENNGHNPAASSLEKAKGLQPLSNGHIEGLECGKQLPISSNGVLQPEQETVQPSPEKQACSPTGCEQFTETKAMCGVKRKMPAGALSNHKCQESELLEQTVGGLKTREVADLQNLKLWLAIDSRDWLLRSGWCDTVRDSFRQLKKARSMQESQSTDEKKGTLGLDTFASVHDSLRQKVPKELKEHLVEKLQAHFAAQRVKER